MGWTAPSNRSTGFLVTAAVYDVEIVDNLSYLHGDAGVAIDVSAGHQQFKADSVLAQPNAGVNTFAYQAQLSGDTNARFGVLIRTTGSGIVFGPGNALHDTELRRTSAGILEMTIGSGFGYGTGTGSTYTQLTSKATAVTVTTPTGTITMNNAALAAGASVSFTVTGAISRAGDLPIVACVNNAAYRVEVESVQSSANPANFRIRVTNITAGSLSDALPICYSIIKGATA